METSPSTFTCSTVRHPVSRCLDSLRYWSRSRSLPSRVEAVSHSVDFSLYDGSLLPSSHQTLPSTTRPLRPDRHMGQVSCTLLQTSIPGSGPWKLQAPWYPDYRRERCPLGAQRVYPDTHRAWDGRSDAVCSMDEGVDKQDEVCRSGLGGSLSQYSHSLTSRNPAPHGSYLSSLSTSHIPCL